MSTVSSTVRVEIDGRVALPVEWRERHGIKQGDLVALFETARGVLIVPRDAELDNALDTIGDALREQGVTLDELIESGRDIREELMREFYGLESKQ